MNCARVRSPQRRPTQPPAWWRPRQTAAGVASAPTLPAEAQAQCRSRPRPFPLIAKNRFSLLPLRVLSEIHLAQKMGALGGN